MFFLCFLPIYYERKICPIFVALYISNKRVTISQYWLKLHQLVFCLSFSLSCVFFGVRVCHAMTYIIFTRICQIKYLTRLNFINQNPKMFLMRTSNWKCSHTYTLTWTVDTHTNIRWMTFTLILICLFIHSFGVLCIPHVYANVAAA